jgi:hypothetical protein
VKSADAQEKQQMPGNIEIQRIYKLWDDALGKKDLEASLALYADDASIESPLVQHLMKTTHGLVQGKDNLRKFITLVFQTTPPERKRFRTGFFTDGRVVTWEYPRATGYRSDGPRRSDGDRAQADQAAPGLLGLVCAQRSERTLDTGDGSPAILSPLSPRRRGSSLDPLFARMSGWGARVGQRV